MASMDQSTAVTSAPRMRRHQARHAQPAAELEHATFDVRRERLGERPTRRPQLCPVRDELVLAEGLLVDQRVEVARPEEAQLEAGHTHRLLDQVERRGTSFAPTGRLTRPAIVVLLRPADGTPRYEQPLVVPQLAHT